MANYETIAQLPSRRNKAVLYTVKRNTDTGLLSCDCPGWINSIRDPRSCRHTLVFEALMGQVDIRPGSPILTGEAPVKTLTREEAKARNDAEAAPPVPDPELQATSPFGGFQVGSVYEVTATGSLAVILEFSSRGARAKVRYLTGTDVGGEQMLSITAFKDATVRVQPYLQGASYVVPRQPLMEPQTVTILTINHLRSDKRAYELQFQTDQSTGWFPVQYLKGAIWTMVPGTETRKTPKRKRKVEAQTPTEPSRMILRAITFEDD